MSKFYQQPEVEIRLYSTQDLAYTESVPETNSGGGNDLNNDDIYDPFG